MEEYAIFNSEGCIERQLWSLEEAKVALAEYDDDVYVEVLCHDHSDKEQPRSGCELCE